jgi:N6-adenosine-specific RNA methylase IME4
MKKYRTILADPPWQYRNSGVQGAAEKIYPTMPTDQICDMRVGDIAHKDAVLILWCTWPLLEDGFKVLNAWGFEYKSGMPWIKIRGTQRTLFDQDVSFQLKTSVGFWVLGCSEPILICKRGNASPPVAKHCGLLSRNIEHSRKPDDIYAYAESFPGPYLELFARRVRDGWDSYGNEVETKTSITSALSGC